ncbi:hypothetical protein [Nostoc sp.]
MFGVIHLAIAKMKVDHNLVVAEAVMFILSLSTSTRSLVRSLILFLFFTSTGILNSNPVTILSDL